MSEICPNFTSGHIALIGLTLDACGAILLSGTDLPPLRALLKKIWPWYKKVTRAGEQLRTKRKISGQDYGFETLAEEILSLDFIIEKERADFTVEEVKYESIEFENEDSPIENEDEIIIQVTTKDSVSDSLNSSNNIEWGTAVKLVKQEADKKLRVCGALLLASGFGLLLYSQLSSLYELNLFSCL
jgi:hypothetical protein